MPELPEVEIVKQSLQKSVYLRQIANVEVKNRNLRYKIEKNFGSKIKDKKIINISRRAKYLIVGLDDGSFFTIHLGMSGTLHIIKNKFKKKKTNLSFYQSQTIGSKHNHLIFNFNTFKIIYNDPRRFGFVKYFESKTKLDDFFSKTGYEPLSKYFNFENFKKILLLPKKNIKNILLDQKIVSGIGNIYASEILFHARIKPNRPSRSLNARQVNKIILSTKYILKKAINRGGSSIRDFKNSDGNSGLYQNQFMVYNKKDELCINRKCNNKIQKIMISNRSTFYCKNCQK